MAKSLRSKWKRKMRAIKREKLDEKVLIRLKKMLATAETESKIEEHQRKVAEKKKEVEKKEKDGVEKKEKDGVEMTEVDAVPAVSEEEAVMEVEGETLPKRKVNLRSMKNQDNQYPPWMTTKKIHRHARLLKKKNKENTKQARMSKIWKLANSL